MGKDPIRSSDRLAKFKEEAQKRAQNFDKQANERFDQFKKDAQKDYEDFNKQANAEYGQFKKDAQKDYEDFNKQANAEYGQFKKEAQTKVAGNDSLGVTTQQAAEPKVHVVSNEEKAAEKVAKAKDRLSEQGVSAAPATPKVEGITYKTEKGHSYTITEDGVVHGKPSMANINKLEPKMYSVADNGKGKKIFACGPVRGAVADATSMDVKSRLSTVVFEHEIYNDIVKRGDNSNGAQAFKEKHKKDLDAWGLAVANGNLYQTNPKSLIGYTSVKDMGDLEKKIALDKKEAAKDNPILKQIQKEQTQR